MKIKNSISTRIFNLAGYISVSCFSICCLLPFLLIISGSLSSEEPIAIKGYSLIPRGFTTYSYKFLFTYPEDILRAYSVSIAVTVTGTFLSLFIISMAGYVLQRSEVKYRNRISFFIYFTTMFQGGLIPWYILIVNFLKLNDSYLVLILNGLCTPFLIILMRSFIKSSIPTAMIESSKIDGAGDFRIYYKIVLPLAKPALATVGLFVALAYWNDWYNCLLFIEDRRKYNLQFFMYNMLTQAEVLSRLGANAGNVSKLRVPGETAKLAMAVLAVGPIVFAYPFVQRYFVKGLTLGAVKG